MLSSTLISFWQIGHLNLRLFLFYWMILMLAFSDIRCPQASRTETSLLEWTSLVTGHKNTLWYWYSFSSFTEKGRTIYYCFYNLPSFVALSFHITLASRRYYFITLFEHSYITFSESNLFISFLFKYSTTN